MTRFLWFIRTLFVLLALVLAAGIAAPARAQNPDEIMPAASAAKAKALLDQTVQALGGQAYLNLRDLDCKGRVGQFDSAAGEAGPSLDTRFLRQYPDNNRTEMESKSFITDIYGIPINTTGHIVAVYSDAGAWSLGKTGVTDMGADALSDYKAQLKSDMNNILRYRLAEDGLILRYGGADIVDLKEVDWVNIADKDQQAMRIAIDSKSHLPVRSSVSTRDPLSGRRLETVRAYSNYHPIGGVQIAFQTSTFVNDRQTAQTFFSACQTNVGLSPNLFTRAALDDEYAHSRKKSK